MTDYNDIVELDDITLNDCEDLFTYSDMRVEINDGRIVNLVKCGDK